MPTSTCFPRNISVHFLSGVILFNSTCKVCGPDYGSPTPAPTKALVMRRIISQKNIMDAGGGEGGLAFSVPSDVIL